MCLGVFLCFFFPHNYLFFSLLNNIATHIVFQITAFIALAYKTAQMTFFFFFLITEHEKNPWGGQLFSSIRYEGPSQNKKGKQPVWHMLCPILLFSFPATSSITLNQGCVADEMTNFKSHADLWIQWKWIRSASSPLTLQPRTLRSSRCPGRCRDQLGL